MKNLDNRKNATLVQAQEVIDMMLSMQDEAQRTILMKFFKTAPGQYGEGDLFLGLKVPQTRSIVKQIDSMSLEEIDKLLVSPYHEVRLCGFLVLVAQMKRQLPTRRNPGDAAQRDAIVRFYLSHTASANNWDLVDLSCPGILGVWLLSPSADGGYPDRGLLDQLAHSSLLWEQRIAIVSNWILIRAGQYQDTLRIATLLLGHNHDLMHKAVGWMLREVGKRDLDLLREYLDEHISQMSRTTLRYAIEKMPEQERKEWLRR